MTHDEYMGKYLCMLNVNAAQLAQVQALDEVSQMLYIDFRVGARRTHVGAMRMVRNLK